MNYSPQGQQPVYVVSQVSPETEGAATTALWLEIIFGLFSLLGVGHIYTGRIALGIILMIGWWLYIVFAAFVSAITLGIAACLFGPSVLRSSDNFRNSSTDLHPKDRWYRQLVISRHRGR